MAGTKNIWVLPETDSDGAISRLGLGLLTEAVSLAARAGGSTTALLFGTESRGDAETLGKYGVNRTYFFRDPLFSYPSAEAGAAAVLPGLREERPWLFLLGHTTLGRELAGRLGAILETGIVGSCARIDLTDPEQPKFYRTVYAGQLWQEIVLPPEKTMLVTMDPDVLNARPTDVPADVETLTVEPKLSPEVIRVRHIEYLPADFRKVDVAEAGSIVAAGAGAATGSLLPMVEELAALLDSAIGTTRPVVDEGKIPRERMIGQTGKVVSPDFYLALGISGASHHVGGIQDSGKIVAVNRDPTAPIFRNADFGISADLAEVLPELIKRIRQAKENGEIL